MKIWYIHPSAGGPGVGRYWRAYHFARHWEMSGHEALIISAGYHHLLEPDERRWRDQTKGRARYAFVPTIKYRGNGWGRKLSMLLFSLMLAPYCLVRALFSGRPDVMVYSSPHPFGYVSTWLAARVLRARLVFEVRDIWPLSLVELADMNPASALVRATGWIERFAYRRSDKVVSLLPCAKEHMVARGLSPEKFSWIPNGVGVDDASDNESGMSGSDAIPLVQRVQELRRDGYFVVVYAGALGEPNSIDTLLQAFSLLKEYPEKIRLLLIGRGVMARQLIDYANSENLSNVEFHDQIDKADVLKVLRQASAGYISLRSQPIFRFGVSPNKLWDYMLAELPVVFACKAGNNPVADHHCGISADPADPVSIRDAIVQLCRLAPRERDRMGACGRQAVLRHYEYEKLAAKFIEALGPATGR